MTPSSFLCSCIINFVVVVVVVDVAAAAAAAVVVDIKYVGTEGLEKKMP